MTDAALATLIDNGLEAVDDGRLDDARSALNDARGQAGEQHARVLHLAGMIAWAEDDYEHAAGYLMQAADQGSDSVDIYLDCAECLFKVGEDLAEAEATVRMALQLEGTERRERDGAHLLLAQIRLEDDDVEQAEAALDEIDDELKKHPAFLSTLGAVQLAKGDTAGAVASLEAAVAADEEDGDMHYHLGIARHAAGDEAGSRDAFVRTLELDEAWDKSEPPAVEFSDLNALRGMLEEVMEDLPDPILKLVGTAPITVQERATEAQVRDGGVDPRSVVAFVGTPKSADEDASLEGIVVMHRLLADQHFEEDELPSVLFMGLMGELRRFFQRDDIVFADA